MLLAHQNTIISNLSVLVKETDLDKLVPELLNLNVFNERMISRILNPSHSVERQKTDLYVELLKRGPQAFAKLQNALISSNHLNLAKILSEMNGRQTVNEIHRSPSLNSVGSNQSNTSSDNENDGPRFSLFKESRLKSNFGEAESLQGTCQSTTNRLPTANGGPNTDKFRPNDLGDFPSAASKKHDKVFTLPEYEIQTLDNIFRNYGLVSPNDVVNYSVEVSKTVEVVLATQWQVQEIGKPALYKMTSNPRGYALIVNNEHFYDSENYPQREGSKNDVKRFTSLLQQFHFEVEVYIDKTKKEMEKITKDFSQKPELNVVDSICVVFMSHGEEGEHDEESLIIGVDGVGYKTDDIVSLFFNDMCKAMINKPKMFFFQACRGNLLDTGVTIGYLHLGGRIQRDGGNSRNPKTRQIKVRTHSDIFVAFAVAPGRMSNRDKYTGAWFIQYIVDVFSKHAWNTHLEDLMKMVDEKIKKVNNLDTSNFQAVSTKTFGWNKNLYFNPGLCIDENTNKTVYLWKQKQRMNGEEEEEEEERAEEGMDVVDTPGPSNNFHFKRENNKDKHEEDSDDSGGGSDCFNLSVCRTS